MLPIQTILVPTDFSDAAGCAFAQALWLAERCRAAVHLVHVIEPLETGPLSLLRYTPEAAAQKETPEEVVRDLLTETARRHEPGDAAVESVILERGPVAETLLRYASEVGAGLIVMGRNRHQGLLRRERVGSTTGALLHRDGPPVVVVPASASEEYEAGAAPHGPAVPVRRMLLPVDFSDAAEQAVPLARALAACCGASLSLLFVAEHRTVPVFKDTGLFSLVTLEPDPEIVDRAPEALAQVWQRAGGPEVPSAFHVREGDDPAHQILAFAEEDGTDLIVLASDGVQRTRRFGVDDVTEAVLRHAHCPVCVVPLRHRPDD